MNTTVNNNSNDQSYGSSSTDNNTNLMDIRMKSIEDQIKKLTLTFSRYVKEPITSNNNISKNQENNNNSDKENEDNDDDSNNDVDIPTEYQLSDSLFNEYKHLLNNQGLLVEEQCILKKNDISDFNKTFCFPSNFQVNVAPFGTPDDINKIMSTTDNNNHASSSTENNSNSYETRMKSLEDQISNLSLAFTRYMKEPMRESYRNSDNQRSNNESETENEQGDDESIDPVDVPTDYQLSESLLANYKHLINNQGLLVEEKCILKKNEIADVNKIFCFPSNFQVNVAPFGTPEGISASSNLKNNDTDLYIVEKRINDILKPILLLSSMISSDKTDIDTELLGYLADSSIQLVVSAQATLSRVRRNNISKEIYVSKVN
ncbi:hypothetical protein RB653_009672 [Dictyostelium firmibasis]|uniref:Uncharacterized protein n=1 Tax=Dictyostelium firmibasis TaxID=79012 RepID=A0AAN7YXJ8_9MYCE